MVNKLSVIVLLMPKYLVLTYDLQSLNDILNSALDLKEVTLLLPYSLYKDNILVTAAFGKVIKIRNYLNSAEVEVVAYTELSQTTYQGIIATHEVDILRAARLRTFMSIPGQNYDSALAFRRKTIMKGILQHNQIKVPLFKFIESPTDIIDFMNHTSLPLVIKPDLGTGSEDVKIFQTRKEILSYLKKSSKFHTNQPVDMEIEEFVEGKMYHINGFILNGKIIGCWPSVYPKQSICMTQGNFASSYLLHADNPLVPRLNTYAQNILGILPVPSSMPFHLEVFINKEDEIIFCEIASRIGGKGIRQSWLESFGMSLGRLFVHTQANLQKLNEDTYFPEHPKYLTGEIWFPAKQGKLDHIEQKCPFPWVMEYQTFYKSGDIIHKKMRNINDCLCGISLMTAETEEEMQYRLDQIAHWVYKTVKWSAL